MSNTDRARQNSEYVRGLLKKKWPAFAAALERVIWELTDGTATAGGVGQAPYHPNGAGMVAAAELVRGALVEEC